MSSLLDLRDDEFEERVLKADRPVLVEFSAPWCGPCRNFAPIVGSVLSGFKGRLRRLRVDTDESVTLPARCDISKIPTLILFRDGEEVARQEGKCDEAQLKAWLDQALQ